MLLLPISLVCYVIGGSALNSTASHRKISATITAPHRTVFVGATHHTSTFHVLPQFDLWRNFVLPHFTPEETKGEKV